MTWLAPGHLSARMAQAQAQPGAVPVPAAPTLVAVPAPPTLVARPLQPGPYAVALGGAGPGASLGPPVLRPVPAAAPSSMGGGVGGTGAVFRTWKLAHSRACRVRVRVGG